MLFLELLEERAIAMFGKIKNNGKTVSSNIDFYSGFVYEMIGLPQEIFTPLFAMARIVGWCAHRNEEPARLCISFLVEGKSRMPLAIMMMGMLFNLLNGFMQGEWLFIWLLKLFIRWTG